MATSKEIRRRIKSATNTKQIIKAMELVSVVKMQKAVAANFAARPYAQAAIEIISEICAQISSIDHPFFYQGKGTRKLAIVVTTDRGLCGSLNVKIIKKLLEDFDRKETDVIIIGKKGRDLLRSIDIKIIAEFVEVAELLHFEKIQPIIKLATSEFLSGEYESVRVVYPHFESTLSQDPRNINFLPFRVKDRKSNRDAIRYEPDKTRVLTNLIPRILENRLWQALLEAVASEHSARMVSMKNADENAGELIDDLTLTFNQTRQAGITSELAEISAGKMTLEE